MSQVIALIPARAGSKGIPGKNTRRLGDATLIEHAALCAFAVTPHVVLTTDIEGFGIACAKLIQRPADLAQDDTPMLAVVQHALKAIPGEPDDVIVLLQPTQPFRTPAHVTEAIRLLRETQADSILSVVQLPLTHSPIFTCRVGMGPQADQVWPYDVRRWDHPELPTRRQDADPAYVRDGTCYAFWRRTVMQHGTIYGQDVRPLVIAPEDTCKLDTEADWDDVTRRWQERHATPARS